MGIKHTVPDISHSPSPQMQLEVPKPEFISSPKCINNGRRHIYIQGLYIPPKMYGRISISFYVFIQAITRRSSSA